VKASSPHGAAACNETTTILDYPSGEGRHGRSICAGRTSGKRDCHSAVRMREIFFRRTTRFRASLLLESRATGRISERGEARVLERERERLGKRASGAARLTNRSIVGGKTIRSLTSLDLDPALSSSSLLFPLFLLFLARTFSHTCIYANRAPARRTRQVCRSRIYLPFGGAGRRSEGDLYKESGLLCAAGKGDCLSKGRIISKAR